MWTRANLGALAQLLFRQGRSRKEVRSALFEMRSLPVHRLVSSGPTSPRYDIGACRTWTDIRRRPGSTPRIRGKAGLLLDPQHPSRTAGFSAYSLLMDWMAEGKGPVEIAYLMRRDVEDVTVACKLVEWMTGEMKGAVQHE